MGFKSNRIMYYSKMKGIDYAVLKPLEINWRFAQPAGFDGIEVFVDRDISIIFTSITNGPKNFALGSYLTDGGTPETFEANFLTRISEGRINAAFKEKAFSIFFTEEEADELKDLFEKEQFIAKGAIIKSEKFGTDLLNFDEESFNTAITYLRRIGAVRILPMNTEDFDYEELRNEMYDKAYKQAKTDLLNEDDHRFLTKSKIKRLGAVSAGLFAAGAITQGIGKKIVGKGLWGTIGGAALVVAGTFMNLIGFKISSTLVSHMHEGVIFG